MIALVSGRVVSNSTGRLVVNVGGVGFTLNCPVSTAANVVAGTDVELFTTLVVREDSLTLYGFASPADRDTFEVIMAVSGIGPKIAMAAIDTLGSDGVRSALGAKDIARLVTIPGVGKKSAERMALELSDKVGDIDTEASASWQLTVASALESLGWTSTQATAAVRAIADEVDNDQPDIPASLRLALQHLGNG